MPGPLDVLDAAAVRRWCEAGLHDLTTCREEIDDLNVYPVPDGDTGTNLVLTMESVVEAVRAADPSDLGAVLKAMAHGALMGARGNSGVILSQLLRGIAEVLGSPRHGELPDLCRALERAADLGYAAVAEPVEGTVLSVARAAADAATRGGVTLSGVARAAADGARVALARTPDQLPALAQAGVVDAGGRGLCVLLDTLVRVITGESAGPPPAVVPRDRSGIVVAREAGSAEFGYEVQYLLDADDTAVGGLKTRLAALGDSLVVVGGDGLWNVHVHVNDVGAAVEAGVEAGRPHRITVTRFADQIAGERAASAPTASADAPGRAGRGVVAVAAGPGLVDLFVSAGATVVTGGPSANPSTREILDAIAATGAREVLVLPNDGNVVGAARQAADSAATTVAEVHVVPSRSPVQGLAALAVHDPARTFADDAIAMTDAARATRWGEVTTAVRDAQTTAGQCRAGDVLGLVEGDVVIVGAEVVEVADALLDRLLASGGELVTVITGADASADSVEEMVSRVRRDHPVVDVEVHDGGQPHYPLILGVE